MNIQKKYFTENTNEYLKKSFEKGNFGETEFQELCDWLSSAPKWSTIRLNRNKIKNNFPEALIDLQAYLDKNYQELNERLNDDQKINEIPKCRILSDLISECAIFDCSVVETKQKESQTKCKMVIIDLKCAQAVFRGANIFIPGVISVSYNAKENDEISIYADLDAKCLKGSDANLYAATNPNSIYFVGNGWLLFDRDHIFKNSSSLKNGTGVKVKRLKDNYYIPSLDDLDESKFYLQNLPSIICARVLDPQQGDLILDMCAAPGGKTTHIAEIVSNQADRIIAFDKISNKIEKMKELCAKLGAKIECFCQDAMKIDFELYKPNTFDRILVDAPCSALGQRPLIFNEISANQLNSYQGYQKMILEKAVKLLKPGGVLVYSTCTITIEENEEQVNWLLNKFQDMELISQEPYYYSLSRGLRCSGLSSEQSNLLQRFMPNFQKNSISELKSVYGDTNGFFIAKFHKKI